MVTETAQLYAGVLLDLVVEGELVDQAAAEIQEVEALFRQTPGLDRFFANPVQKKEHKRQVVNEIVEGLNLSELLRRFLGVLLDNGRLHELPAIADAFRSHLDAHRGVVRVEVESARALSAAEIDELRRRLGDRFGRGVEVEVSERPELIGGLVAHVKSEEIDGSLRGKLRQLRTTLLQGA